MFKLPGVGVARLVGLAGLLAVALLGVAGLSDDAHAKGKKPAAKPVADAASVMPSTAEVARSVVLAATVVTRDELSPASSPAFPVATAPTAIVTANIQMPDRLAQLR